MPKLRILPEERGKPFSWPEKLDEWDRESAIAVMCHSLARLLHDWGYEGDAEAVMHAKTVLLRPDIRDLNMENKGLHEENIALRRRIAEMEARDD